MRLAASRLFITSNARSKDAALGSHGKLNSCVNWAGWILQTYSNTVILKDTQVSTFVMTRDGIHHCQFCSIFDVMNRVGASVARLGGKQKILAPVGTAVGPEQYRHESY
jgi:hypothetical protein